MKLRRAAASEGTLRLPSTGEYSLPFETRSCRCWGRLSRPKPRELTSKRIFFSRSWAHRKLRQARVGDSWAICKSSRDRNFTGGITGRYGPGLPARNLCLGALSHSRQVDNAGARLASTGGCTRGFSGARFENPLVGGGACQGARRRWLPAATLASRGGNHPAPASALGGGMRRWGHRQFGRSVSSAQGPRRPWPSCAIRPGP